MSIIQWLDEAEARYTLWYETNPEDDFTKSTTSRPEWVDRDEGESLSHMIVRNDVYRLIAELRAALVRVEYGHHPAILDMEKGAPEPSNRNEEK